MNRPWAGGLRPLAVGALLTLAGLHASPAPAGEGAVEIDLQYGEEINDTCAGCHGERGAGSPDGEYPRLAGISAQYLAQQLRAFKTRERLNIPMFPYTTERELPEDDLVQIAAYLSQIDLPTRLASLTPAAGFDALERLREADRVLNIPRYPGDLQAGERLYARECRSCHGAQGEGDKAGPMPMLAGQHSLYLMRQMQHYREGKRVHDADPGDAELFRGISDGELEGLLAYLSVLDDR